MQRDSRCDTKTTRNGDARLIAMLGVDPDSEHRGGIASVIDAYRAGGLFTRWPIVYVGTYASGSPGVKLRVLVKALWTFVRLLGSGQLALVHAHTASRASFWRKSIFVVLAFVARTPVIVHLHGAEFEQFYRSECGAIRRWCIRAILNRVDRIVVLSSQWKSVMESIAPETTVVRIFNPVSVPSSEPSHASRASNVLLFLGRLGRRKGIFDLLRALPLIAERFPDVRLRCGGDGDLEGVIACSRELGVERHVEVLGWVSGVEKERVLQEATIYVLPSYAEGLPMGVLEAMAAGAPVISTTVGGIPDAIEDQVDGFLIAPGDVSALAERIMELLGSVSLRKEFASRARTRAHNLFSTETVLAHLEDTYEQLGALPRTVEQHNHGVSATLIRTHE